MQLLIRRALEELRQGNTPLLAVITAAHGSTPRGVGAAMLVGREGYLAGTVGGGELEFRCVQRGQQGEYALAEFSLNNREAAGLGMTCGGSAQVLFLPLTDEKLLEEALTLTKTMEPGWLLLPLTGGETFLSRGEDLPQKPQRMQWQGEDRLCLPLQSPGRIYIFGGGHVALELSRLLDVLGYPYVVVDDREEFSGSGRFPGARQALTAEFTELSQVLTGSLRPGERDCLCVMTRGHLSDGEVLRYALQTPAGYIGLMGSRRKREKLFAQLSAEGFPDPAARIVTPIGLDLGGRTPAEVALSVAAQLVAFRNQI